MILSKEEFLQQYVLNRALCNNHGLDGSLATEEAIKAYKDIEETIRRSS